MDYEKIAVQLVQALEMLPRSAPQNIIREFSKGEAFLLNFIYKQGGTARPGEMSEALGTSTARIAAAINNMERKGLVRRETDSNDRRRTLVHLTDAGNDFISSCRNHLLEHVKNVMRELGEKDTREFLRISAKIAEISKKHPAGEFDILKAKATG